MTVKGAKASCDRYWSQLVKMRGCCERCGDTRNLEAAHIIRRRFVGDPDGTSLRTNVLNGWCLCHDCHRKVDEDPVAFATLIHQTIGTGEYDRLLEVKVAPHRPWRNTDWIRERKRLRALLNAAGSTDRETW